MKNKTLINIAAFALGGIFGSSALQTAQTTNPPISWGDIPVIFFGCVFGAVFVLGIQILRRDSRWAHWGIRISVPIALFVFGAGSVAVTMAAFAGGIIPPSLLFLSIGVGLLIGLAAFSMLFRWKFKQPP
jgi:hypothetical protein